jgi:anti-sigma regulatory factor (Ser/Thr protein kinase)
MIRTLDIARDDRAPLKARQAFQEFAGELDPPVFDEARLLVTELVSNSVRHGAGDCVRVIVDLRGPRRLRCEVIDQGSGFLPLARPVGSQEDGGWGLLLVESLSESWGVREGSTHVWFELARDQGDQGDEGAPDRG